MSAVIMPRRGFAAGRTPLQRGTTAMTGSRRVSGDTNTQAPLSRVTAYQSSVPSASAKGATAATVAPPRPKPPLFSAVQDCTIAFAWSAVTA